MRDIVHYSDDCKKMHCGAPYHGGIDYSLSSWEPVTCMNCLFTGARAGNKFAKVRLLTRMNELTDDEYNKAWMEYLTLINKGRTKQ